MQIGEAMDIIQKDMQCHNDWFECIKDCKNCRFYVPRAEYEDALRVAYICMRELVEGGNGLSNL